MNDLRDNPVSTRSAFALHQADHALWQMMSFYGPPIEALDAAAEADPAWVMPPLMKAGFLLSLTEPTLVGEAAHLIASVQARLNGAHPRERAHAAALQTLAAGDWAGAGRQWEALLLAHPRDALVLQWAHLFDFYQGDAVQLRQRVARVLPEWPEDDPLRPYVLGLYAFGLEECNLYSQAEDTGRRALSGEARVPWAIHAVAHVMEMQGRHEEGGRWMAQWRPHWAEGNGFAGHLGWHQALFALEALDFGAALALFDEHLRADPAQITLQRLDAASLLWRLHLLGADVGGRWQALLSGWNPVPSEAGHYAFNDLHALLAMLGAGDLAAARRWLAAVEGAANANANANANAAPAPSSNVAMARQVGLPLMHGLLAFAEGRHSDALALIEPVRAQAHRFGGSHAQRDLLTQTVLAASAAAGDKSLGRALMNERRADKPDTPLTRHWLARLGLGGAN
jgi:hypothetical protein